MRLASLVTGLGAALVACGQAQPPAPTVVPAPRDPCALVSAAQVSATIGTAVSPGARSGTVCTYTPLRGDVIGDFDPAESPPPNVPLVAVTIADVPGPLSAALRADHLPPTAGSPVPLPDATQGVVVGGPHWAQVLVHVRDVTVVVTVGRGKTDDPYLEQRIAGEIVTTLAGAYHAVPL